MKVNNGEEALRLLWSGKGFRPDFIFLDINMPVINGKKCLDEIMKSSHLEYIPVIIYTTSKRAEDREETQRMGAVHFITKPSSLVELCNEITFVLENKWKTADALQLPGSRNRNS